MTEGEKTRLIAWNHELRAVHDRLREALAVTRAAVADGKSGDATTRDLLLFCRGFCAALTGHHEGEDQHLFPAIEAEHPELGDALRALQQDHSMIAHLLNALEAATSRAAPAHELDQHLEGIAAIMESHFHYEERVLTEVLSGLNLDTGSDTVLGPL